MAEQAPTLVELEANENATQQYHLKDLSFDELGIILYCLDRTSNLRFAQTCKKYYVMAGKYIHV